MLSEDLAGSEVLRIATQEVPALASVEVPAQLATPIPPPEIWRRRFPHALIADFVAAVR